MFDLKLKDLYQVKITLRGNPTFKKYGIVYPHDANTKALFAKGFLVVSEALTAFAEKIPFTEEAMKKDYGENLVKGQDPFTVTPIPIGTPIYDQELDAVIGNEFDRFVHDEYLKAQIISDSAKTLVGKLFCLSVGDGSAYYVVTKETKSTVHIEWRGFSGDRYTDQILGWGGSFPKARIAKIIRREEALRDIFSKKEKIV